MKTQKIGILGGGQLAMLLAQAAIHFPVKISAYDPDANCSARSYVASFTQGNFDDTQKIIEFGKAHDVVIFETESIDIDALKALEADGIRVVSSPETLEWIRDKGKQKEVLRDAGAPIPAFEYVAASEVRNYNGTFPVVQKWRTGGYDGYGVTIHENADSLKNAKAVDSTFEEVIEIEKEISILLARGDAGDIAIYPPIEMVFDFATNMVDYLVAPAKITQIEKEELFAIAKNLAEKLNFIGIYAIECFIDKKGQIYVNEIAPRPHNSGHHTISANVASQYEQQIRIALGLPLGSTEQLMPCVMMNLLAENATGKTKYVGLEDALAIKNVQYTFYSKEQVRPSRKMGHAVIFEKTLEKALQKMNDVRTTLTITSDE